MIEYVVVDYLGHPNKGSNNDTDDLTPALGEMLMGSLLHLSRMGDESIKMMFVQGYIVRFVTSMLDIHN